MSWASGFSPFVTVSRSLRDESRLNPVKMTAEVPEFNVEHSRLILGQFARTRNSPLSNLNQDRSALKKTLVASNRMTLQCICLRLRLTSSDGTTCHLFGRRRQCRKGTAACLPTSTQDGALKRHQTEAVSYREKGDE